VPERLRGLLCRGLEASLAALAYIYSEARVRRGNVLRTLKLAGTPLPEAERVFEEVDRILSSYVRVAGLIGGESLAWRSVEGVVVKCLDSLGIVGEAWRRVEGLDGRDSRLLRIASLVIARRAAGMYYARGWDVVASEHTAELASVLLLEPVDPFTLERLLVGGLLAVVSYRMGAGEHVYRELRLIPNTTGIIKALADSASSEWPSRDYVEEALRKASPCEVAALLGAERTYYEAVYGCDYGVVVNTLAIRGIAFRGSKNPYIQGEIEEAARRLALEACGAMMEGLAPALRSLGYALPTGGEGRLGFEYCCKYTAARPGSLIAVYTCPYAVTPPTPRPGERAVVVVEGMGAGLPGYIGYLERARHPAARALWLVLHRGRLYVVASTAREAWQGELVEALRESFPGVGFI